jgi:hypothetical protein
MTVFKWIAFGLTAFFLLAHIIQHIRADKKISNIIIRLIDIFMILVIFIYILYS